MGSIVFLTAFGQEIGVGHLTRCLALCQAFESRGFQTRVLAEGPGARLPAGCAVEMVDWQVADADDLRVLRDCATVIIDSRVAALHQIERIASICPNVVVIDDSVRHRYRSGLVVDWTIDAEQFAYRPRNLGVSYLLGTRYCVLRPEFSAFHGRGATESLKNVLVTFGGSDVRGLTEPVLEALLRRFPDLHCHAVLGRLRPEHGRLRSAGVTYYADLSAARMRDLMRSCDIAVCSGGQTLYEMASQALPAIAICAAEDQRDDIHGFERRGFVSNVGAWDRPAMLDALTRAVVDLQPRTERDRRAAIGLSQIDGHGAERLVDEIVVIHRL